MHCFVTSDVENHVSDFLVYPYQRDIILCQLTPSTDVTKTDNGERRTENGERGTGNRERESGNERTAVTRVKIQHGGQKKRKGNNLGKCEEVLRL